VSGSAPGLVSFVGAGPGAPDLLTLRAVRVLGEADIVIWARSLVDESILGHCRADAELIASDDRTLEDVVALYARAATHGLRVARVASGDPTLYGALNEQLEACRRLGLDVEIVPGVSSVAGAAAALGQELTVPDVSQTLILTRRATRTSMPANEELRALAAHGTTMALFLSVRRPRELQAELLEGGYAPDAPCAVVYRATWPDEIVLRCRLDELGDAIRGAKITTQALVLIGPALDAGAQAGRSHVYDPGYGHRFRPLGAPAKYRTKRKAEANASVSSPTDAPTSEAPRGAA
jgi:precorrin-4 C11-methyltransferase